MESLQKQYCILYKMYKEKNALIVVDITQRNLFNTIYIFGLKLNYDILKNHTYYEKVGLADFFQSKIYYTKLES